MRQNRIIPVIALASAVAAAGTACSSSGTVGSAQAGAGGDSAQAMTLLAKMTPPQVVAASTKAVASKQSAKIHMTSASPLMNETANGVASFGSSLAMDVKVTISSGNSQAGLSQTGQTEMRMTSAVAYLDISGNQHRAAALQGKRWMKIDFGNLGGTPALADFSFMKDMAKNNDPSTQLKSLLASPDLKKVGQEEHNGLQTLHFAGGVTPKDMLKATAAGTGLTQKDVDDLDSLMTEAGVTSCHYDVWVDGQGLPVELKFSEDTKMGKVFGDLTYSDWGTPVTVTAPPADQTVDIAELLKSQQG